MRSALVGALAVVLVSACSSAAAPTTTAPSLTSAPAVSVVPATSSAPSSLIAAPPSAPPVPSATSGSSGFVDLGAAGAVQFDAPLGSDFAALAGGFLVTTDVDGGMEVYELSGKLLYTLSVPGGACGAPDVGFGAIWTATCAASPGLARIDDSSFYAAPVDVGGATDPSASVAAAEGGVWLIRAGARNELIEVNPQIQSRSVVFSEAAPDGASAVRAGYGAVWVASPSLGRVTRIDPGSGDVVATIDVGHEPQLLAIGDNAVWTLNQADASLSRIDPATNGVVATVSFGEVVDRSEIAFGGGYVWVRGSTTLLYQIDPSTNKVFRRYGPATGSGGVAADDSAVWMTAHDSTTIWRLPLDIRTSASERLTARGHS